MFRMEIGVVENHGAAEDFVHEQKNPSYEICYGKFILVHQLAKLYKIIIIPLFQMYAQFIVAVGLKPVLTHFS